MGDLTCHPFGWGHQEALSQEVMLGHSLKEVRKRATRTFEGCLRPQAEAAGKAKALTSLWVSQGHPREPGAGAEGAGERG